MGIEVKQVASKIVDRLVAIIEEKGLELLRHYPKDLLEIDRAMLEAFAYPGAQIAWMVGDSHTHMFPLGIHQDKNIGVTWVTNLANNDCFFLIKVSQGGFSVAELNKTKFEELRHTPVKYSSENGDKTNFCLLHSGKRIAHINAMHSPKPQEAGGQIDVGITLLCDVSEEEREVIALWADSAATKKAGSLFTRRTMKWVEHQPNYSEIRRCA